MSVDAVSRSIRQDVVGDTVQVATASGQTLSGFSSIAAGSEARVRLKSTDADPRFVGTGLATVLPDGTWSVEFDFSAQRVSDSSSPALAWATLSVTEDGEVVEEVQVGEPEPRTVIVESPTLRVVTRTVVQERRVLVTQTPGQPGFGIAVAIVGLLAVRRRD